MISYRDMTFCKYYANCRKGLKCLRALTLDVYKDAEKWWGGSDAPICVYAEYPECFIPCEDYDDDIPYRDEN